jgi:vacuolar-type H+-ATPase subunit H
MSSAVEATVKALVDFESELERAKAGVSETKRRTTKDAGDWAEAARATAVSKAQELASQRVARARRDAEAEADKIRKKGESDLKAFENSISSQRSKAAKLVASKLLGETE